MRWIKNAGLFLVLCILALSLTACWSYHEIEDFEIVAGVAIDREEDSGKYTLRIEVIEVSLGGKESNLGSKILTSEGATIFDAIRNAIQETGRRLYFSHAKILIVSREIAEEGIIPVLDMLNRDAETRYDVHVLIAEEKAGDIFLKAKEHTKDIVSYALIDQITSNKSLSKAPDSTLWLFLNALESDEYTATLPLIRFKEHRPNYIPEISGTGVFKKDKLIGVLDEEDTKTLLFIMDKIKGGIFIVEGIYKEPYKKLTLEIFNNKTIIKPRYVEDCITMEIDIKTDVAVGENMGSKTFSDSGKNKDLEMLADKEMENKMIKLVKKVQKEFKSDIFGFGKVLNNKMPNLWDEVKDDWEDVFTSVTIEINSKFVIRNYGAASNPIKAGM